jgi:hypothetical protein
MPRVVPSQIVELIDYVYPGAAQNANMPVYSGDAAVLAAIIYLADDIPAELIVLNAEDYTRFVFGLESMGAAIDRWNHRGGDDPPRTFESTSPVVLVRNALVKCPDQNPSPTTSALSFISDADLRESIRLDISSAANAISGNDFKSATVLAGSAIEAMLLWALQSMSVTGPLASMKTKASGSPDKWNLAQMIEAASLSGLIKENTATQADLARDFRNLIHPGKAQRLSTACNKGTAYGAIAAVELVASDLQP